MRRDGSRWTYEAKLEPGVYHYAFVAEDGTWFVPCASRRWSAMVARRRGPAERRARQTRGGPPAG